MVVSIINKPWKAYKAYKKTKTVAPDITKLKPSVKETGTKQVIEHYKKVVTGLKSEDKASIYKSTVAPYVRKWSGKKKDIITKKQKEIRKRNEESKKVFNKPK